MPMNRLARSLALALLLAAAGAGRAVAHEATLYARLGSQDGVDAIATMLIEGAAADPVLGRSFKDTNLKRIEKLLAEQLCELTGGPCRYSGDPMREVHAGLGISQAEFYGMVDLLRDILRKRRVDTATTNELLRLLAPMKRDIVERAGAARRGPKDADARAAQGAARAP